MLAFLPGPLRAVLAVLLFVSNTIFWCLPFYCVAPLKLLSPQPAWRAGLHRFLIRLAEAWADGNNAVLRLTQRIEWDIQGLEGLRRDGWYLLGANHQSWVDIAVVLRVFNRRIPFPKFFIKRELIWVPLLGGVWWALDYPFMKRHSADYLARHPEARGRDWETARRTGERLRAAPSTLLIFLEGTRFRPEKHARQQPPYRHLLRPKSGGLAAVLDSLGGRAHVLLDVTIVYPDGHSSFLDLALGRIRRIVVRIRSLPIPDELLGGDYRHDPAFRATLQDWIGALWAEKDALIDRLHSAAATPPPT
ncbi:MAG: acyltransferase [Candidatus Competibacteraceae bacterium]|nr:acyltransferase [Candidatus Competibacteraceae bacterium]MBK7982769.1 acyltransferase [Candidatus Competibacteraceae bacterium]MBK8898684.1 acyltransferase [Candidatus Competibacteraceae bacterium]MBK8962484.1 acyltransferase [Candidatus Competibacteraceae bacterium]MBK9951700.1 acyltransferase [Candidatus Competibacteraceae bacterium]